MELFWVPESQVGQSPVDVRGPLVGLVLCVGAQSVSLADARGLAVVVHDQLDRVLASADLARQHAHFLVLALAQVDESERRALGLVLRVLPVGDAVVVEQAPASIPGAEAVDVLKDGEEALELD